MSRTPRIARRRESKMTTHRQEEGAARESGSCEHRSKKAPFNTHAKNQKNRIDKKSPRTGSKNGLAKDRSCIVRQRLLTRPSFFPDCSWITGHSEVSIPHARNLAR